MAVFTDDSFNKYHTGTGAGTLIGNWAEEQVIRDCTGEGRTVPQRHLPRSGLLVDWTKVPDSGPRKMDDTFQRVYGLPKVVDGLPESTYSAACVYENDCFKTEGAGPQERVLAVRHMEEAEKMVLAEEAIVEDKSNARSFETTKGAAFTVKPAVQPCAHLRKSYAETLQIGAAPDPALAAKNEGITRAPANVHYSNQEAISYNRMAMADPALKGSVKVSPAGGISAFGRNSAFSKPMGDFKDGLLKDEAIDSMFETLKGTNAMRTLGGSQPRGGDAFAGVPSLASLKETIHMRIGESLGAAGFVVLRMELANFTGPEGTVPKGAVIDYFRTQLGLTVEEVSDMALDVYLEQMCTTKGGELMVSALLSSLRPALSPPDKLRAQEAFQAMGPMGGSVPVEAWLPRLQDGNLREVLAQALGCADLPEGSARVPEKVYLEICTDLALLLDLGAVL